MVNFLKLLLLLVGFIGGVDAAPKKTNERQPKPELDKTDQLLWRTNGEDSVGTRKIHLIDKNRNEPHIYKQIPRELMGQIWYPCDKSNIKEKIYYDKSIVAKMVGNPNFIKDGTWKALFFRPVLTCLVSFVLRKLRVNGIVGAPVKQQPNKFPIIIVDHGFIDVGVSIHTALCEELASQGYFVIGVDHTYAVGVVNFPDGRQIKAPDRIEPDAQEQRIWVEDIQFLLDQLEGMNRNDERFKDRLDLKNIGMVGHSFGGSTAVEMCRLDERVKAGINMDGSLCGKDPMHQFKKPFMFLLARNHPEPFKSRLHALFSLLEKDSAYFVEINNAFHIGFSDVPLLIPRIPCLKFLPKRLLEYLSLSPQLSGERFAEITQTLVVDFFNKHLQGKEALMLNGTNECSEFSIRRPNDGVKESFCYQS